MHNNALTLLLEKMSNIENRQYALEVEFIDYRERNPKPNNQWIEMRLRALEHEVKTLKERQSPTNYNKDQECP